MEIFRVKLELRLSWGEIVPTGDYKLELGHWKQKIRLKVVKMGDLMGNGEKGEMDIGLE